MLRLVLAVSRAAAPLAEPILKRRLARGKEDPTRWREKLGEASAPRPNGPLVWMHGVGVGEVMALRGLIAQLAEARPDLTFLVTSSARSSAAVVKQNLPPRTIHQYLPLDFPKPVTAFLDHWQPDVAVWSDQEVWPRLAVTAARRGVRQAYVAARITDKSAKARAKFGRAYGDLYGLMDAIHAQDHSTKSNLSQLIGHDNQIEISGSLKAAAAPLACIQEDLDDLKRVTEGRRIWCLASAHPGDEAIAIEAHEAALKTDPSALLIIVPRDPSTGGQMLAAMQHDGLQVSLRSASPMPPADAPYFIADTFGELGLWYRIAAAALIGGTFGNTEGHNPWEPVALGCPVLHGPRTANFKQDFETLGAANAAQLVDTPNALAAALLGPALPDMADRAGEVLATATQDLPKIAADVLRLLNA